MGLGVRVRQTTCAGALRRSLLKFRASGLGFRVPGFRVPGLPGWRCHSHVWVGCGVRGVEGLAPLGLKLLFFFCGLLPSTPPKS